MEVKGSINTKESSNVTKTKTTQNCKINSENESAPKIDTGSKVDIKNNTVGTIPKETVPLGFTSAKISNPPPEKIGVVQGIFVGSFLAAGFAFAVRSAGPKAMIATGAGLAVATALAVHGNDNNNKLAMSTGFAVGVGTITATLGTIMISSGVKGAVIGAAVGGTLAFSGMYFLTK